MNLLSLLQAPADTNSYYIAGYAIFFTVMAVYLASLVIRGRNLKAEYELLKDLEEEEERNLSFKIVIHHGAAALREGRRTFHYGVQ